MLQNFPGVNLGYTVDMWTGYDQCLNSDGGIAGSLVCFDMADLPPVAAVSQATLHLYLSDACEPDTGEQQVTVYRAAAPWIELEVNWDNQPARPVPTAPPGSPALAWDGSRRT